MATLHELVTPFRGERYSASDHLSRLLAPPYDVIRPPQRAEFAGRDEHNIVHVMLPEAPAGTDAYARAAQLLAQWRAAGALGRDAEPTVTVMAQTFTLPDGSRRTRTGVFGAVAAEGYGPRRVRPHERTHRGPKVDRLALLRATRTNVESIFLLAPDPDGTLADALARVTAGPATVEGALDDVAIRLWVVSGDAALRLTASCSRLPLYIADGHHRYETASAFAAEDPAAARLLGFVVSLRDPGLVVLPTHRIVHGAGRDLARLLDLWRPSFEVTSLEPEEDALARLAAARDRTACVVAWPGGQRFLLALKPDADLTLFKRLEVEPTVQALDVARIELMVVKEVIRAGDTTVTLDYSPDGAAALARARGAKAAVVVLLNPTPVAQVLAVADAGGVMPPKSTYFVPKVPSGVVLLPVG